MFETHDVAKLPFIAEPGEHYWSYVFIHLNCPWFLAEFSTCQEYGYSLAQTAIFSNVSQLTTLARRNDIQLRYVELSSPGHINGTDRWQMEPLREIRARASNKNQANSELVFLLENGKCYGERSGAIDGWEPENSDLVFSVR